MPFRPVVKNYGWQRAWAIAVVGCIVILGGCGNEITDPDPTPAKDTIPAAIVHNMVARGWPGNVVAASVELTAARFDSLWIEHWAAGTGVRRTPTVVPGQDTTLEITVFGLAADAENFLRPVLFAGDTVREVDSIGLITDSLPEWIPVAGVTGTDTTPGFLSLSYPAGPVVIDNSGRVVWYLSAPNGNLNSFQVHANGRYSVLGLRGQIDGFYLLDPAGNEVVTISCVGRPTRFHDVRILAAGDYWIMCDETRSMDLSGIGGVDTASVTATVIQHVSSAGAVLFEWNAFDHFDITDVPSNTRGGPNVNFTHGNAIELAEDGNLIVSFRSLNEVTKINVATGDVMWRFGGVHNQFQLLGDSKGAFQRQHGLRRAGPGEIQFLDNGSTGPPSRFVRYRIDEQAMTATLLIDFRDSDTTFTGVGGATEYYPNGHAIVTFGRAGRVVEIDAAGARAWELTGIDGIYVFRTQRYLSLYTPQPLR